MRNMLSRKVTDIEPSGIRKFFDIVSEMPDAISLGVGEPDFDTPWHIREEGIYSLEKGRTFYTSNSGLMELRQEICNYLQRRVGVSYNAAKETLVTVGGSEAIDIALRALLEPGEEVLNPAAQLCFLSALHGSGRRCAGSDRAAGEESVPPDEGRAAGCHHSEDEGSGASVPEQPDRCSHGEGGSGGDCGCDY